MRQILVGHNNQKEFFKKAIDSDRLSHAYILAGINGIGKKLFAINLSKSLLCENGSFFEDCQCTSCRQIDNNLHGDLHFYSGKTIVKTDKGEKEENQLKIENIREIIEISSETALYGKYKIFILDEADRLAGTGQAVAANAFLKTLEEPAPNTIFILITSKLDLMLPTIKSRCNIINFNSLSKEEIEKVFIQNNFFKDEEIDKEDVENINDYSYIFENNKLRDDIYKISNGSVGRILNLTDLNIHDTVELLLNNRFIEFRQEVLKINDFNTLRLLVESVYPISLDRFKKSNNFIFSNYGDYLLELLSKFNYNINLDLAKNNFASISIEVFSERV